MTTVEIPGIGDVEFPESMTPDQVMQESQRLFARGAPSASRRPAMTSESLRAEIGSANPLANPKIATTAARVVPPIVGSIIGAPAGPLGAAAGGAAGGAAGEWLAQQMEGRGTRWPTIGLEAGLSAIPFGRTASTALRTIGKRALQGVGIGAAGGTARIGLEEGRLPTAEEAATMGATGGVLGGLLGGGERWLFGGPRAATAPPHQPTGPLMSRQPIAALPAQASPTRGLSEADIITAQRGMTKRNRTIEARRMKAEAKAAAAAQKQQEEAATRGVTVSIPRPWETLPDAPPVAPPTGPPPPRQPFPQQPWELLADATGPAFPQPPTPPPTPLRPLLALPPARPLPVTQGGQIVAPRMVGRLPEEAVVSSGMTSQEISAAQKRLNKPVKAGKADTSGITVTTGQYPQGSPATLAEAPTLPMATPESPTISRMRGLRDTIEDARSTVPTGKQFYRDPEGNIVKTGNAGALLPRFRELFPEIDNLPPGTTPKELVTAIDKDRGNKLYLQIKEAVEEQMAKEAVNPAARAERHPDFSDYEQFSKAFDEVVNAPEAAVNPRAATQPKLFQTQAEMPPEPLRSKVPQVEHGELLEGFKKPEAPAPELPLGGRVSETPPALRGVRQQAIQDAASEFRGEEPSWGPPKSYKSATERTIQKGLSADVVQAAKASGFVGTGGVLHKGDNLTLVVTPEGSWRLQDFTLPKGQQERMGYGPTDLQDVIGKVQQGENIVELGMGLQIPRNVKERVRKWANRATTAYAPADRPSAVPTVEQPRPKAGVRHRLGTIFDRALGQGEGKKFADMVDYSEMWTERDNLRFSETPLLKLSETELVNAMQAGEGRARPLNARVAQFVQDSKAYLSEKSRDLLKNKAEVLEDAIYEAGAGGAVLKSGRWRPYQPLANYFFQQGIDFTRAAKYDVPTLTRFLRRDIPDLGGQGANEMAEAIIAQAKGRPLTKPLSEPVEQLLRRAQPTNPSLHARTGVRIPDEIRILPDKSVPLYVNRINKDLAALQTYGPRDAEMEGVLTRAFGERRGDAALAKEQWDIWRGRNVTSPAAQSVSWWQRALNNIVSVQLTGPITSIRQASQLGPVATMLPTKHLARGLASAFTKSGWRGAQFAGALTSDLIEELSRQRTLGETISRAQTGTEKVLAVTGRAAQVWGQGTGQRFMDAYFRVVAQAGAKSWFKELQTDALAGNTKALAELKRWGLTPTSAGDEFLVATKRASDFANRRAGPLNVPVYYYQKGGLGELARHLNSFSISSANYVLDGLRNLTSAMKRGDHAETVRMLKLMAKAAVVWQGTGEVLGDVIRTAQNRPDDRPGGTPVEFLGDLAKGIVPPQTVINRIVDNYLFSGPLAMVNSLKEAVLYAQGGPRESQLRVMSQIVGPGISSTTETAAKVGDVISKELAGAPPPGKKTDPRIEARKMLAREVVRKLVPGGQAMAPLVMPASKGNVKKRALAGFVRAERRGQPQEGRSWLDWYSKQQGKPLSPRSIQRGLLESMP